MEGEGRRSRSRTRSRSASRYVENDDEFDRAYAERLIMLLMVYDYAGLPSFLRMAAANNRWQYAACLIVFAPDPD